MPYYRVISVGSSSVMAFRCTLSFGGSAWVLRGGFWLPIHDKLQPIRNRAMADGKNKAISALLRLCCRTICKNAPNYYNPQTVKKLLLSEDTDSKSP
jgi:hypothetical protein